jgi:hypothetical protein
MKEKKLLKMLLIAIFAIMSVGFAACGSDDDDDVTRIDSPIVGTWKIKATQLEYTLQFTNNGQVSLTTVVKGTKKLSSGTFEVSSGYDCIAKIYWSDKSTPEIWEIVVSGNKMTTKSAFSSSQLTWTKQ